MALELLKAAASVANRTSRPELTPGILRFSLEYNAPPEEEVERAELSRLLESDGFSLFRLPSGADPCILILQFDGVPREQSSTFLFQTAQDLTDQLKLRSCTPDVEAGWLAADELGRATPESIGGIVWEICRSRAAIPSNSRWAVHMIKSDAVFKGGITGRNIRIGQPDTGVADHAEIDGTVNRDLGLDVIKGSGRPIDPLAQSMSSPGHGTATSSCVVSSVTGRMTGAAPEATLIPFRCVNAVVLTSGAAVATAIDEARKVSCDIITMSLGGPVEFRDLKRAIKRAVDDGIIVLAAAGNCVGWVVYPAWDENVIAVAAIDENGNRWKGSSFGEKVDVAAPGENVYVARRTTPDDLDKTLVEPAQGTSFAVALTAGCAALWLHKHSKQAVFAEAARRQVSVQDLFRAALRQSVDTPPVWPGYELGTGIINAEKLVALDLNAIVAGKVNRGANPGVAQLDRSIDLERFAAEAGYIRFLSKLHSETSRAPTIESAIPPRPSSALRHAIRSTGGNVESLMPAPFVARSPLTPQIGPRAALTRILGRQVRGEGGGVITEAAARSYLEGTGGRDVEHLAEKILDSFDAARDPNSAITKLRGDVRQAVPLVLRGLKAGARTSSDFKGVERIAAEALVRLTGRPALRLTDGMVSKDDPLLEEWAGELYPLRKRLREIVSTVGRIDAIVDGHREHVGTGFVVGPGVVMTNRHVIDAIADPIPLPGGKRRFHLNYDVTIAFDDKADDDQIVFRVKDIISAGPERIGAVADIRKLDMALLAVESVNAKDEQLPLAQPRIGSIRPNAEVAVVGFPASPNKDALIDPDTGELSDQISDRLGELFQNNYGEKYLCPGEIGLGIGGVGGDVHNWVFTHDATTLRGNSGSCVINLHGFEICGLHFGGAPLRQNLAHGLGAVRAIIEHDGTLLRSGLF